MNTISIALLLALWSLPMHAEPVDRVAVCDALARVTVEADKARERGVPEAVSLAQLESVADPDARAAGEAAIWYAYTSNGDGRLPRAKLAAIVRRACLLR